MCLAQSDAAVDEKRVVGNPRVLPYLTGRGPGELIGFALHELIECEVGIEVTGSLLAVLNLDSPLWRLDRSYIEQLRFYCLRFSRPASYFQYDPGFVIAGQFRYEPGYLGQVIIPDPVENELVRCQQAQTILLFQRLKRPYPGVELL